MPCGCCDSRRSTDSASARYLACCAADTVTAAARASRTAGARRRCRRDLRQQRRRARRARRSGRGSPAPSSFLARPPLVSSAFFVLLGGQRRRHGRGIVGTELHQLAQRGDHFLTRVTLDAEVRQDPLLTPEAAAAGFSASCSGVRLSLLTASSFAPAATSVRMMATCRAVHRLVQRRRAVRRLGVRVRARPPAAP